MRVVLDTNIWLSGTFWEGEAYKLINTLQRRKIEVVITKKILLEIVEVLNKEAKFQKFIKNRKIAIEDLLRAIVSLGKLVDSKTKLSIVKEHISDNKILESAVDGKAKYVVSYDNHLLKLKKYKNTKKFQRNFRCPKNFEKIFEDIKILNPTEFLKRLN